MAWIRLSNTCNNRCVFCAEADRLDGTIVDWPVVQAAIDAAAEAGETAVILSGGEPTLSKHLIKAIRHAKGRGLRVALTTNGRMIQSVKIAQVLEKAGLDEVRVSVHSGIRRVHDGLAQAEKAWVEGLQGLRMAGRTGMKVVLHTVLSPHNTADLHHLLHLVMMGGATEMVLRRPARVGAAARPEHAAHLDLDETAALRMLSTLWYEAKEEGVLFRTVGFEGTADHGHGWANDRQGADRSLMGFLRGRVHLDKVGDGVQTTDEVGMAKDFVQLCQQEGGLAEAGLTLRAKGVPLRDAPWCVGGEPDVAPDVHGDAAVWGEACGACPLASRCPGLARKLGKVQGDALAPRTSWRPLGEGAVGVVVAGTAARQASLAALADALEAAGRAVHRLDAGPVPEGLAAVVVPGEAAGALAGVGVGTRRVVIDGALGAGLVDGPAVDEVWSPLPDAVDAFRQAGLDPRALVWGLPPVARRAVPATGAVVLLTAAGDGAAGLAAAQRAGVERPIVVVGEAPEGFAGAVHAPGTEGAADALAGALLVLWPRRGGAGAEALAGLAEAAEAVAVAAAHGVPVVAWRGLGTEDVVRHDLTGRLAPQGDLGALAAALTAAGDPEVRARLSEGARRFGAAAAPAAIARGLLDGRPPAASWRSTTKPWPAF